MGWKLIDYDTPAAIPDRAFASALEEAQRKDVVETMAAKFQVTKAVMERRLGFNK